VNRIEERGHIAEFDREERSEMIFVEVENPKIPVGGYKNPTMRTHLF
jgi:hypothetical protein